MYVKFQYLFFIGATIYHAVATIREKKTQSPPGELIDIDGYNLHLYSLGEGSPTVILDHSLGGIEGYFLIEEIAKLTKVCIYDRAGYGWSQSSPKSRCSKEIVRELDLLLTKANIAPPYILVGNSFGSYNVRLYAHMFPEKVRGIILTDGLHERELLAMPFSVVLLKFFFLSGFIMSIFGSLLGLIRLLGTIGIFEVIKPELRKFDLKQRQQVKKSFYHYSHWLTMARELWNLDKSSRQLREANNFNNIPIISIKSKTFFQRNIFNFLLPLKTVDKLRDKIHENLSQLSNQYTQISANNSSHFVWIDEPKIIVEAVKKILRSQL